MTGMYEFLLTVHVLAAVLWVGGGVTLHILIRRALRQADARARHEAVVELEWVGSKFFPVFSITLIIAGVLLVTREEGGWDFDHTFIQIGFTAWIISFLIGVGFYEREGNRRTDLVDAEGAESPAVASSLRRTAMVNSFELLILVLAVVAMTTKPGWP